MWVIQRDTAVTIFLVVFFQLRLVFFPGDFLRFPREIQALEEVDAFFSDGSGFSNLIELVLFALFGDLFHEEE